MQRKERSMTTHATFSSLHQGPGILLLPNAWDAGSARLIESLGAKAIATTSAGLAWSRGYRDGDALPIEHLLVAVHEIVRVIRVPLSIDVEGGYSADPDAVAHLAMDVANAGAAGINIEDGTASPELTGAKIEVIKQGASCIHRELFINVRTDVYLRAVATGAAAVQEVIRRAERYRVAGCDGIFVPGLVDAESIQAIVAAIDPLPLNLMLMPGLPSIEVLQSLGVRRLSAGSALAQAGLGCTKLLAKGFLDGNFAESLLAPLDYNIINRLFPDAEDREIVPAVSGRKQ
jgi:2-methylisocitrate lyase-like PEP mutase family enzyme